MTAPVLFAPYCYHPNLPYEIEMVAAFGTPMKKPKSAKPIVRLITCPKLSRTNLGEIGAALKKAPIFSVDIEATGLDPFEDGLLGVGVATRTQRWYVPFVGDKAVPFAAYRDMMRPIFADPEKIWNNHHVKFDLKWHWKYRIRPKCRLCCSMTAAWLVDENRPKVLNPETKKQERFAQKKLEKEDLGVERGGFHSVKDWPGRQQRLWGDSHDDYASKDAFFALMLTDHYEPILRAEGLMKPFEDIELATIPIAAEMEYMGLGVDVEYLTMLSRTWGARESEVHDRIIALLRAAHLPKFNLHHPQSVSNALFRWLKWPIMEPGPGKKQGSVDDTVLRRLHQSFITNDDPEKPVFGEPIHELPWLLYQLRQLRKQLGTYIEPFIERALRSGRIRGNYKTVGTTSGRWASDDPNLQNLANSAPIGVTGGVKRGIRAGKGRKLVCGDSSMIELRISAYRSRDPALVKTFNTPVCDAANGESCEDYIKSGEKRRCYHTDVHLATSIDLSVSRDDAKPINFGIQYKMGPRKLIWKIWDSSWNQLTLDEGRTIHRGWLNKHWGIRQWQRDTERLIIERGYITTLGGRRRRADPKLPRDDPLTIGSLTNASVQGSAADIIKLCMKAMWKERALRMKEDRRWRKAWFLSQVHDEVLMEAPEDIAEDVAVMMKDRLINTVDLKGVIPLGASVGVGDTWAEAKK